MSAPLYGAWLDLEGRECLVVGGGEVATRRVRALVACGALVRVIAPEVTTALEDLAAAGAVMLERRTYQSGDAGTAHLVCAATPDREVNARVGRDGRAAGSLVNLADDPAGSDFHAAAVIRQGPIALALGTGGLSPTATAALRTWLAGLLTPEHGHAVELLARARGRAELAPIVVAAAQLLARGDAIEAVRVMEEAFLAEAPDAG
jgi:siroheme synthase-like protein